MRNVLISRKVICFSFLGRVRFTAGRGFYMKITAVVFAVLVIAAAVWWQVTHPSGTWRYKMTVMVETPEGVKTGSAVREITVITGIQITPESKPISRLTGEAVIVDLGERGVLFALLKGNKLGEDYAKFLPFYAFPYEKGGLTPEGIKYYRSLKAPPVVLEPDLYPQFVHFKDIDNPKTVELVMEMKSCGNPQSGIPRGMACIEKDRFEEIFGEGVRLKSVTAEMTDEPITLGQVSRTLKWLEARRKARTKGAIGGSPDKPFYDPTNTYLTSGDFIAGDKK